MANPHTQLVTYLDATLDAMLERPAFWGALGCVELQVLRLLEVRLLVTRGGTAKDTEQVMAAFLEFLVAEFPAMPGAGLSACVRGDLDAFTAKIREFCNAVRAQQDTPSTPPLPLRSVEGIPLRPVGRTG